MIFLVSAKSFSYFLTSTCGSCHRIFFFSLQLFKNDKWIGCLYQSNSVPASFYLKRSEQRHYTDPFFITSLNSNIYCNNVFHSSTQCSYCSIDSMSKKKIYRLKRHEKWIKLKVPMNLMRTNIKPLYIGRHNIKHVSGLTIFLSWSILEF